MSRRRGRASWWRPILVVVLPVVVSAAAAMVVLFDRLVPGTAPERLDTVRTALTVAAGIGALITLALALRRQQATEHDASERRLTELYVKAVDQLGSDKPAVRHGGLYALERVAQDNPDHRQTVVDVICAYLRGPFTPPAAPGTRKLGGLRAPLRPAHARTPATSQAADTTDENTRQEREVRLTAQRILRNHLQPQTRNRTWYRWFPRPHRNFWADLDLDLTGATLVDLDLSNIAVRAVRLDEAQFSGDAWFDGARLSGDARFCGAQFCGDAWFRGARFSGDTVFDEARFSGYAMFNESQFSGYAMFTKARFSVGEKGDARFCGAQFNGYTVFKEVQFNRDAMFNRAQFDSEIRFVGAGGRNGAVFDGAQFSGVADFDKVRFGGSAGFSNAQFSAHAKFNEAQFSGSAGFKGAQFGRGIPKEISPHLESDHDGAAPHDTPVDPDSAS